MNTSPLVSKTYIDTDTRPAPDTSARHHMRDFLHVVWIGAIIVGCGLALAETFSHLGPDGVGFPASSGASDTAASE